MDHAGAAVTSFAGVSVMALRVRHFIVSLTLPIALLGFAGVTAAQTTTPAALHEMDEPEAAAPVRLSEIKLSVKLKSAELRSPAPLFQPGEPRDSLANGTLIGAAIGAAAAGVVGGIICKVFQEPSDPSCVGDTFRIAAVGAAIGAGAGVAIDAALTRQGGVQVSVRKRF